jgi:hypothetical protein
MTSLEDFKAAQPVGDDRHTRAGAGEPHAVRRLDHVATEQERVAPVGPLDEDPGFGLPGSGAQVAVVGQRAPLPVAEVALGRATKV